MYKKSLLYVIIISTLMLSGCIISGKIANYLGEGMGGITVSLSGDASQVTITDENGYYQFGSSSNMLAPGNYRVTPLVPEVGWRDITISTGKINGFGDVAMPVHDVDFILYDFQSLYGYNFVLAVDRTLKNPPAVQFPTDDLQESNYEELNEIVTYDVTFSEDGQIVIIEPGSIYGQHTNNSIESLYYELGQGTFAGGRFIVWINDNEFEVELTIYGSGLPIVKSERGYLIKK